MQETDKGPGNNDLPDEMDFDYTKAKPNRFAELLRDEQVLIPLDPDVAAIFGDADSVNRVLRALIQTMPPVPIESP